MSQLPDPIGRLTPEAQRIYDRIVGSRGHDWPGLFRTLMLYPELAERFADFGTLLRFDGVLRADLRELAILTVARDLRIAYIWETHQENAAKAGLTANAVADLLGGKDLAAHDPLYPAVTKLVRTFLDLQPVPQELQDRLVAAVGLPAFVQLSVVIGYYRMIAGLARGFEFPLPAGMRDPFAGSVAAADQNSKLRPS
jgi:4-carboxymuconolactone decarboxylase